MKLSNIISMLFLFFLMSYSVHACGCGLALSDMKVFNELKETQAYLMIDIQDETSYREMPFFRMVSMDEPYNVTIVFPMAEIPYDVKGRTITAGQFLKDYNISNAETVIDKQSLSGVVKVVGGNMKDASPPVFALANGLPGLIFYGFTLSRFGALASKDSNRLNPLAHFEFEGGTLDIYDVKSMDTLEALVQKLNLNMTGEVEKLITKYKDYYVAVLYLKVPSVIDPATTNMMKSVCPQDLENVKKFLQEHTEISYQQKRDLISGACSAELDALITSVTNVDENVKGTLVDMYFKDTNKFFYPTSIVNSYKYPITDQKYLIKTPSRLNINLDSSEVDKIGILDDERWYKVTSSKEDIKGTIIKADFIVRINDFFRKINQSLYDGAGWLTLIIYLVIIVLPFIIYHYKFSDNIGWKDIFIAASIYLVAGLIVSGIVVMLARGKKRFGCTLLILWGILLALWIISGFLF